MSASVLVVDFFAVILAVAGFTIAFRQGFTRRLMGRPDNSVVARQHQDGDDPLAYIMRIGGVMVMVFGIVIGGMVTLFHMAS